MMVSSGYIRGTVPMFSAAAIVRETLVALGAGNTVQTAAAAQAANTILGIATNAAAGAGVLVQVLPVDGVVVQALFTSVANRDMVAADLGALYDIRPDALTIDLDAAGNYQIVGFDNPTRTCYFIVKRDRLNI
jgi:hypothetical protein